MKEESIKTAPAESEAHMPESTDAGEAPEPRVYELGYHIVPTVSEEAVGDSAEALKRLITDAGGACIDEEAPQHVDLAYTMVKESPRGKQRHDTAYFGWIKFECMPDQIDALKAKIDENEEVLRYLLIQTVREDTRAPRPAAPESAGHAHAETDAGTPDEPQSFSEEDVDRAVDELVEGSEEEKNG